MVYLPRYVAFKSKFHGLYLRYVNDEASSIHTFLASSEENVVSPYTKFELETANCDSSLVNIRCCYNNKYLVSLSSDSSFIAAKAEKIEEDKSKWACTLFKPIYDSAEKAYRFRHIYLGFDIYLLRITPVYTNCLVADSSGTCVKLCDLNTIIDWETLVTLPKHVAFKGDNGCYLRARWMNDYGFLEFETTDIGDPAVPMETFTTKDGSIRIKSNYIGKFWRRCHILNSILAESTDVTNIDSNTLFWPTKIDNNTIALRNLGNNCFVKRSSYPLVVNGLRPLVRTIDQYSKFQIEEAVISRDIYDVHFRPSDARIYDQSLLVMATGTATNKTEVPNTVGLRLKYTDTKSSTWNASVSLKLGVKTKIQTKIPFFVGGEVEISAEFSGAYQWGKSVTKSRDLETTYHVTVPPMTSLIVSLLATQGTCDVPYSYTQRDVLIDGEIATSHLDDGVYSGTSCYNFTYQTKKIPMPA
ncbi:uncharacterized protein LOC111018556 [Momordica charantia]|uniref:Uncharacterized protein LOC111018556 n=1 Tax=Momordica charantia TaxID=3673 RepID=A0A6J1D8B5_MOMCH|nr:uncharacterized protein LOC111018556 [Momordica charantia]